MPAESQESQIRINHYQQMVTFVRGTGVEFIPALDENGVRATFLSKLISGNRLELTIPQMISHMIGKGRLLLELYPNGYSHRVPYRIRHYTPDCYRIEQDQYGDISAVKYCYSYKAVEPGSPPKLKWVCQRVTSALIESAISDNKPDLDQEIPAGVPPVENPLGYLPYVEVLNPPPAGGNLGESDFEQIQSHLDIHEQVTSGIVEKILEFCYNPLITNKSAESVYSGMYDTPTNDRNSVAHASGFSSAAAPPIRKHRKLKKVFGDFENDDRLEQLQINPVPTDHQKFSDQYEQQLREALGGILERGIETATESRVVYGKVIATAKLKQAALFKYGLCELFAMALLAEEALFIATAGRQGLPLLGDRSVNYRIGAVFMPTAQDTLQRSIVGRNLTEVGVNSKETMKWIFPDKTESEIDMMVGSGGIPIRYLTQVIQMFAQANQTLINPVNGLPYVDANTGGTIAEAFIPFILNALSYGREFTSIPNESAGNSGRFEPAAVAAAVNRARRGNPELVSRNDQQPTRADQPVEPAVIPEPGSTSRSGGFFDLSRSPILNLFERGSGRRRS